MSDQSKFYRLLMVFSSLEPLKLRILLILAHLSPQRVSASELTMLLGYSKKARTIYRGVLDQLQEDGFIVVDKITPKHFSIQISPHHPVMAELIELVIDDGDEYTNQLVQLLSER
ncbi:MAG: hypothetical protein ACXAD7_15375 [Candidatus Kariarchaeaceae archaeon]|jgi:hypothetical protein